MRYLFLYILLFVFMISGCRSYPRYRGDGPTTPMENQPTRGQFDTEEFLRLGTIMRTYLGKPYKGKSRYETGIDCSMFTRDVFQKYNQTELPRTAAEQYKAGVEVTPGRLMMGDLVFYKTERRKKISHVGIYLSHNEFMHASTSRGVIITNMSEKYWAKRFVGARRVLKRQN